MTMQCILEYEDNSQMITEFFFQSINALLIDNIIYIMHRNMI